MKVIVIIDYRYTGSIILALRCGDKVGVSGVENNNQVGQHIVTSHRSSLLKQCVH